MNEFSSLTGPEVLKRVHEVLLEYGMPEPEKVGQVYGGHLADMLMDPGLTFFLPEHLKKDMMRRTELASILYQVQGRLDQLEREMAEAWADHDAKTIREQARDVEDLVAGRLDQYMAGLEAMMSQKDVVLFHKMIRVIEEAKSVRVMVETTIKGRVQRLPSWETRTHWRLPMAKELAKLETVSPQAMSSRIGTWRRRNPKAWDYYRRRREECWQKNVLTFSDLPADQRRKLGINVDEGESVDA